MTPTIDFTDDELAAVAAAIRRAIERPTPRASIRCARRWESWRRPQSQPHPLRPRLWPEATSALGDNLPTRKVADRQLPEPRRRREP